MIKNKIITLLLLAFPLLTVVRAQEASTVRRLERVGERMSESRHPSLLLYRNPSLMSYRYDSSMSEFHLGYKSRQTDRAVIAQEGKGNNEARFEASSYTRLSEMSTIWGSASYYNGKTKQLQWNENAHFRKIYPYVVGDDRGGDTKYETYDFTGGYARKYEKYDIGICMRYVSGKSYRTKDPRPRNTTLDVKLRGGGAWHAFAGSRLAAYVGAEKYSQDSDIKFMNPLGVSMVYQMTGLGTHYFRFKGDGTSVRYEGSTFEIGAALMPNGIRGLSLSASASRRHTEKQLATKRDIPINDIFEDLFTAEAAWRNSSLTASQTFKFGARLADRDGQTRIFDDGSTFYHEIATARPFNMKMAEVYISAAAEKSLGKYNMQVIPVARWSSLYIKNISPQKKFETSEWEAGLRSSVRRSGSVGMLSAEVEFRYSGNIKSTLELGDFDFLSPVESLQKNCAALSSSALMVEASLRYDFMPREYFNTIFIILSGGYSERGDVHVVNFALTAGVTI